MHWLVLVALVELTGPDGQQRIFINPHQIISLRRPRDISAGHFAPNTQCLIETTHKYVSVAESCERVLQKLRGAQ